MSEPAAIPKVRILDLKRNIVARNDEIAAALRARFRQRGLFVVNLLAGPGAGKTTLLEETLGRLRGRLSCLVIEGDLRTARDAERIAATGAEAIQIVTNGTCHLESRMIDSALEGVDLAAHDAIVVENVGNLVCPSSFDLGESARVVLTSVPEGEDKPEKYPFMFEKAAVIALNKVDLLPYVRFDREAFWRSVERINPKAERMEISCATGEGLDRWVRWIEDGIRAARASRAAGS